MLFSTGCRALRWCSVLSTRVSAAWAVGGATTESIAFVGVVIGMAEALGGGVLEAVCMFDPLFQGHRDMM